MANGSLMKVESISECSPWSILQYFWPALSDNQTWKTILVFFFSGPLRQVLLYWKFAYIKASLDIVLFKETNNKGADHPARMHRPVCTCVDP